MFMVGFFSNAVHSTIVVVTPVLYGKFFIKFCQNHPYFSISFKFPMTNVHIFDFNNYNASTVT